MNHSDIAHAWAHQTRDSANFVNANIFFNGPTIYSYGHHFPMAQMYPELGVILYTTKSYSSSTSKHLGHVWSAIDRTRWEVIEVAEVERVKVGAKGNFKHRENVVTLVKEIAELMGKQERARKHDYSREIQGKIRTLNRYIEVFQCKTIAQKLTRKKEGELGMMYKPLLKTLLNDPDDLNAELSELAKENEEKRREQERAKRERDAEYVEEWKQGLHHGSIVHKSYGHSDLLRMKNGMIETSQGVKIDPEEGRKLWRIVEGVIESGKDVTFNRGVITIDHYSVTSISKDGTLRAGCHLLSGKVITEFVEAQGWNEAITI